MDSGWIKLHRKMLKNALWRDCNANQKVVMITLLLMADHKDNNWIFKGEEYTTAPGQFITSLKSLAEATGLEMSTVRRTINKLEKFGFCTSKSTNKNRLITIENWGKYQDLAGSTDKQTDKQPTSNRQATDKQPTTNKNIRNKECKNVRSIDVDSKRIIDLWNSLDNNISKLTSLSPSTTRYKNLKARLNEHGHDSFEKIVAEISNSSFLKGYSSDWSVTFDWVVKPNNYIKVLEGNYRDKTQSKRKREAIQSDYSGIETNDYVKNKIKTQSFMPKEI